MKSCNLTITTTMDGIDSSITREGEMELSLSEVRLCYREENAVVFIKLQGESAEIERRGDYSLRLHLKRGEITSGDIGIGGLDGEIKSFAHRISYSVSEIVFW